MPLFRRVIGGFHALLRKTQVDRELDAELRDFLDTAAEQKIRSGLSRQDAIRAARVELGSVEAVKDRVRDVGWESVLESVWQDVRYGVRMLRRSPGFAAITIGILALGIGANTAIFSLVDTVMLRRLPVREPEQLVQLLSHYPGEPGTLGFSWKYYEDYRDRNQVFSDLIGVSTTRFQVSGGKLQEETVAGGYVPGNFFQALGMKAAVGRLIDPQDDQLGSAGAAVAVISWPYWKSRFNLDPSILGRQIVLDGAPATVIGVTPPVFRFASRLEVRRVGAGGHGADDPTPEPAS